MTFIFGHRDSIEQRWKKRISKNVQLWNKHYRQLKGMQKSGWNEDKYIEEASALYKSHTGETFRFAKCVPVLHKLPKFDPMVLPPTKVSSPQSNNLDTLHSTGPDDEECIPESAHKKKATALVNNSAPPQGSNMERPMGMKKAKLIKKMEDAGVLLSVAPGLSTDSFDPRNAEEEKMMADMSSVTKELVSVLKAATSNKQDELRMRTHEKWMKMASVYATCGQHDLALATMKKIEDDELQLAASKTARNHDPPKPKEAEEERTTSSASDQHGKGNAWHYKSDDKQVVRCH